MNDAGHMTKMTARAINSKNLFMWKHCRNGQMDRRLFVSSLPKVGLSRAMHKDMHLSK